MNTRPLIENYIHYPKSSPEEVEDWVMTEHELVKKIRRTKRYLLEDHSEPRKNSFRNIIETVEKKLIEHRKKRKYLNF